MLNAINWFEIPAQDFDRAVKFYSTVLKAEVRRENFMDTPNGILPYEGQGIGGAIVHSPNYKPSTDGALVYLNAHNDLDGAIKRVEEAGGKVLLPRTDIGNPGFIAIILDTEGNKIGLNQPRS